MTPEEKLFIISLYELIDTKLQEGRFSDISDLQHDCHTVAERVAWLRITFPARDKVDGWKGFLNKTRKQITEAGRNADKLLFGLE